MDGPVPKRTCHAGLPARHGNSNHCHTFELPENCYNIQKTREKASLMVKRLVWFGLFIVGDWVHVARGPAQIGHSTPVCHPGRVARSVARL